MSKRPKELDDRDRLVRAQTPAGNYVMPLSDLEPGHAVPGRLEWVVGPRPIPRESFRDAWLVPLGVGLIGLVGAITWGVGIITCVRWVIEAVTR